MGYNVAFRTMVGSHIGVVTWTAYGSKGDFDDWYSGKMMDGSDLLLADAYDIVEEGITQERAVELVQTPEAEKARYLANQGRRKEFAASSGCTVADLPEYIKMAHPVKRIEEWWRDL